MEKTQLEYAMVAAWIEGYHTRCQSNEVIGGDIDECEYMAAVEASERICLGTAGTNDFDSVVSMAKRLGFYG